MNDWAEGRVNPQDFAASVAEAMLYKSIAETDYEADIEFHYSK